MKNVRLYGFKSGQELKDIVGNAKAIILPSEWYENGPYSAIEAMQAERPIIGAYIGGIPELINGNGFFFKSADPEDLVAKINRFENMSEREYDAMKTASYRLFERNYMADSHYKRLEKVYEEAISMKTKGIK